MNFDQVSTRELSRVIATYNWQNLPVEEDDRQLINWSVKLGCPFDCSYDDPEEYGECQKALTELKNRN